MASVPYAGHFRKERVTYDRIARTTPLCASTHRAAHRQKADDRDAAPQPHIIFVVRDEYVPATRVQRRTDALETILPSCPWRRNANGRRPSRVNVTDPPAERVQAGVALNLRSNAKE